MTEAPWSPAGARVCVLGADPAGFACADALLERGSTVWVLEDDRSAPGAAATDRRERLAILSTLGADVMPLDAAPEDLPAGLDVVVLPQAAQADPATRQARTMLANLALTGSSKPRAPRLWDENEVAWRLRPGDPPAPWLLVAGERDTARLAALTALMLQAGGLRAAVAGGPDEPVVEAVLHPQPPDVVVVDLGARGPGLQHSVQPLASVLYRAGADTPPALGAVYQGTQIACVYSAVEPATESAVVEADVQEGCRAIGVTPGVPAPSFLGVVDDVLCDRAYVPNRSTSAAELCTLADIAAVVDGEVQPEHVLAVLTAAALARAAGVGPGAVHRGVAAARGLLG